jgi:uncharacterized protein (DUF362 family)
LEAKGGQVFATVAIVKYSEEPHALRKAIELCDGFQKLRPTDRVLIKPNVGGGVFKGMPAAGVMTRPIIIADIIALLREHGCNSITLGEGPIVLEQFKWDATRAYERSGIDVLSKKLGVDLIDFNEEEFVTLYLDKKRIKVAKRVLDADFIIDMPTLKTHNQTKVSLGLKNLKGCLHMQSKKAFHRYGLEHFIALLGMRVEPHLTVIDGIHGLSKGPWGTDTHPLDLIIAGTDVLSCDIVGTNIMGIDPNEVLHIQEFAQMKGRGTDVEGIDIRGEAIEEVSTKLDYGSAAPLELFYTHGVKGIVIQDLGESVCSACSMSIWAGVTNFLAENKGVTFDNIEFCLGRDPRGESESKQVFLLGNCAIGANKMLTDVIKVKGCPPSIGDTHEMLKAYAKRKSH